MDGKRKNFGQLRSMWQRKKVRFLILDLLKKIVGLSNQTLFFYAQFIALLFVIYWAGGRGESYGESRRESLMEE